MFCRDGDERMPVARQGAQGALQGCVNQPRRHLRLSASRAAKMAHAVVVRPMGHEQG